MPQLLLTCTTKELLQQGRVIWMMDFARAEKKIVTLSPVEPSVSVSWVGVRVIAAEIVACFGILKSFQL